MGRLRKECPFCGKEMEWMESMAFEMKGKDTAYLPGHKCTNRNCGVFLVNWLKP